jgi:hypothetical protein
MTSYATSAWGFGGFVEAPLLLVPLAAANGGTQGTRRVNGGENLILPRPSPRWMPSPPSLNCGGGMSEVHALQRQSRGLYFY